MIAWPLVAPGGIVAGNFCGKFQLTLDHDHLLSVYICVSVSVKESVSIFFPTTRDFCSPGRQKEEGIENPSSC